MIVQMFDKMLEEAIGEPLYGLSEAQKNALRDKVLTVMKADASGRVKIPLLVLAPDDGAFPASREAAKALERYIWQTFKIRVTVLAAYLDKTRINDDNVSMAAKLWVGKDRPLTLPKGVEYKDLRVFMSDDEISTGGTMASGNFAQVEGLGIPWRNIFQAGVQGKFSRGLAPFDTGLTAEERRTATRPRADKIANRKMPPYRLFVSNSLPVTIEDGRPEVLTLSPPIEQAMSQIAGEPPANEVFGYRPPPLPSGPRISGEHRSHGRHHNSRSSQEAA
jgi:hypothetical protein